jgi:nucleotidyltransferase substrate binding protein (TIGR01987 family)
MASPDPPLDLTPLRDAIDALAGAIDTVSDQGWFGRQSRVVQNTLLAGAIQSFEFVYELCVRLLKRQLVRTAASPDEIRSAGFRDMLRIGGEAGLVGDVEAWFRYRDMRNRSAHTYNQQQAWALYQDIPAFLADARALLEALERHNV